MGIRLVLGGNRLVLSWVSCGSGLEGSRSQSDRRRAGVGRWAFGSRNEVGPTWELDFPGRIGGVSNENESELEKKRW